MATVLHLRGHVPYHEAHAWMEAAVEARWRGEVGDLLLLLEHAPVLTVGRARNAAASLVQPDGWPVVEVERGGDATLHAPGQLIAWPVLLLPEGRRDLVRHLRALEAAVIGLLADVGLTAGRDPRNSGVWLPDGDGPPRKVCAVGVACRRWVTWHGLALNVDLDLRDYRRLRPCGLDPDTVTRIADHRAPCPPAADWAEPLAAALADALAIPQEGPVRSLELAEAWTAVGRAPPGG